MIGNFKKVSFLVVIYLMSNCAIYPVKKNLIEEETFINLIGSDKAEVKRQLGEPKYEIAETGNSYYIYAGLSGAGYVVIYPYPSGGGSGTIICYLLQFTDEDLLEKYYIREIHDWSGNTPISKCNSQFNDEIRLNLNPNFHTQINLWNRAEISQKAAVHWSEYQALDDTQAGLLALCRAADLGHAQAQMKLGRMYWNRKDIINHRSKSYVLYMLAAASRENNVPASDDSIQKRASIELEYKKEYVLTEEEYSKAMELFSMWKPGQCEIELLHSD